MPDYQHIVAAVDLTDEAPQVLAKAREAAVHNSAVLSIVTVIKPIAQVYAGFTSSIISAADANFEKEARAYADQRLAQLCADANIQESNCHVFFGSAPHEIAEQAKKLGADLIVMGTHTRHGLGRLLGSTTNGVLHNATMDVLAVRVKTDAD